MRGGYIVIRDDVVRGVRDAIAGGDVTFPYKGAFDYFKSLLDSGKPIMIPKAASPTGEILSPTYVLGQAIDDSVNIYFASAYTISVERAYPNRISVIN